MALVISNIDGKRGTPGRLIKVDHAGEFGAVNIYRAQILVAKLFYPSLVAQLSHFLEHEKKHLSIFGEVLGNRNIARCRSYYFCGIGGFLLGFITALLGKSGIMSCTAAVESVVTRHLAEQMEFMEQQGDTEAYQAVSSILQEELEHQHAGIEQAQGSILYRPISYVVKQATELVIWLGLRL